MADLIECTCGALIPIVTGRKMVTCNFCGATYQKVGNPSPQVANITMEIAIAAPERWTIVVTVMVREGAAAPRLAREKECEVQLLDVDELTGGVVYWYSDKIKTSGSGQVAFTDIGGGPVWPFAWNRYRLWARHIGADVAIEKALYLEDSTWFDPPAKTETLQVRV